MKIARYHTQRRRTYLRKLRQFRGVHFARDRLCLQIAVSSYHQGYIITRAYYSRYPTG